MSLVAGLPVPPNPTLQVPAEVSSVSLNHVLELLVAAQREILDTQRDLIRSDLDTNRDGSVPPTTEEELSLIQRYQENSLGLLKAAAEGLVQVIIHWSPSLGIGPHGSRGILMQSRLLQGNVGGDNNGNMHAQEFAPSSSLLVATLAEVEDLQTNCKHATSKSRLYQMMFHWILFRYRQLSQRQTTLEKSSETQSKDIERLSDAIKLRSILLVERVHRVQQGASTLLLSSTEHVMRAKAFTVWSAAVLARRKHSAALAHLDSQSQALRQRETLFETFSLWHRGKLCRRIRDLEEDLQQSHESFEADRTEYTSRCARGRAVLQEEVDRLTSALHSSSERVISLESELQRAQREIEELTAHLDVTCGATTISLKAHRLKVEELEKVFRDRIAKVENDAEEKTRECEREVATAHRWIKGCLLPSVSSYISGTLHHTETHATLQLSSFTECAGRVRPPHAIESSGHEHESDEGTHSDAASWTSSGDSVDRGELMLKLSHLTQEVENLRAEKAMLHTRVGSQYNAPPALFFTSPLMRSASFEHAPILPCAAHDDPIGSFEEKFRRLRRRLGSLLNAKNKTILASVCVRKWMSYALHCKEKGKLDAMELAHRNWVQASVEERDKALIALDERVEDEHRSIQAAMMNDSRASVARSAHLEASPSPLRGTFMSNLSFEGTYGDPAPSSASPLYSHTARRWPGGYRAASPRMAALDAPQEETTQVKLFSDEATQTADLCDAAVSSATQRTYDQQSMVVLENEELHSALSTSHERERVLMVQLEEALSGLEQERVTISELRENVSEQDERLLVTFIQLCSNEIIHEEASIRLTMEYNESRLRYHALQSLYHPLLITTTTSRDHALTEWTKCDSRNHRHACLAADALGRTTVRTLCKDYWDIWQRFVMIRRFENLSEMDSLRSRESIEAHAAAQATIVERRAREEKRLLEETHSREISELNHAVSRLQAQLHDSIDESQIRTAQSKQIIRQLRNDAAAGTLMASRLGVEVVEYCASAVFHKWMSTIARKKLAQAQQVHRADTRAVATLAGKQNVLNARVTDEVVRIIFAKWTLLSNFVKECADTAEHKLLAEMRHAQSLETSSGLLIDELQQRVATMHLEATEVLKPKLSELERQLAEKDGQAQRQLRDEIGVLTESLNLSFRAEKASIEIRHQQYCEELRESEALRTQELLEMQRATNQEEIQILRDAAASTQLCTASWVSSALEEIHSHCQAALLSFIPAINEIYRLFEDRFLDFGAMQMELCRRTVPTILLHVKQALYADTVEFLQGATSALGGIYRLAAHESCTSRATLHLREEGAHVSLEDVAGRERIKLLEQDAFISIIFMHMSAVRTILSSEADELVRYGRFLEETTSSLEHRLNVQTSANAKQQREHEAVVNRLELHAANVASTARITLANREAEMDEAHRNEVQRLVAEIDVMRSRYLDIVQQLDMRSRESLQGIDDLEERHRRALEKVSEKHFEDLSAARKLHSESLDAMERECRERIAQNNRALELDMKATTLRHKQIVEEKLQISQRELELHRSETLETLQKMVGSVQSLEEQHRQMIHNVESSHRHDMEHLRGECQIRIREEVSMEIEQRLEAITNAQQRTLLNNQYNIEKRLSDRQHEHDAAIEGLKDEHKAEMCSNSVRFRLEIERIKEETKLSLQHLSILESFSSLARCLLEEEYARNVISEAFESCQCIFGEVLGCHSAYASAHESVVAQHAAELERVHQTNEGHVQILTDQLVRESASAIKEADDLATVKLRKLQVVIAQQALLARANQAAQHFFSNWRIWALISGFRVDYRSLRTDFEECQAENVRLRHIIAKVLEEQRAISQFSPNSTSPITVVSPLSDAQPSSIHRRTSPSPSRVAEAMVGFSSNVNASLARSGETFATVDAIVAEVDNLIETGRRLRTASRQEEKTQSF